MKKEGIEINEFTLEEIDEDRSELLSKTELNIMK